MLTLEQKIEQFKSRAKKSENTDVAVPLGGWEGAVLELQNAIIMLNEAINEPFKNHATIIEKINEQIKQLGLVIEGVIKEGKKHSDFQIGITDILQEFDIRMTSLSNALISKNVVTDHEVDASRQEAVAEYRKINERAYDKKMGFTIVDRECRLGDGAMIQFSGSWKGAYKESLCAEQYFVLEVGKGYIIPAIENGLIGMKAGEAKSIIVTLGENFKDEELRGEEVVFAIAMLSVKERKMTTPQS